MIKKDNLYIYVLLIFHSIGLFIFYFFPSLVSLAYVTLLVCGAVLFLSETNKRKAFPIYLIIFVLGFTIEYIGIHTQLLFGNYTYQTAMGYKLGEVPLVIGVNWFAIVVSSVSLVRWIPIKINIWVTSLLAAFLCTLMDFIIEPVAVKFDFWSWEDNHIPLSNYFDWFIFSFIFAWIYARQKFNVNKSAVVLYFIWIVFFSVIKLIV